MSAVTYTGKTFAAAPKARPAAVAKAAGQRKEGFFARLVDAFIAARAEQVEREFARYVEIHGRDPIA